MINGLDPPLYAWASINKDGFSWMPLVGLAGMASGRQPTRVLRFYLVPSQLNGNFYKTAFESDLSYGAECCSMKKQQEAEVVVEMCVVRCICGVTRGYYQSAPFWAILGQILGYAALLQI